MGAAPSAAPARPAPSPQDEAADRQRRYREAQDHALVKDLIKRFDADIVSREVLPPDAE